MTAEQVLNHVLPALAGIKPNLTIKVEHHEHPSEINSPSNPHPPEDFRPGAPAKR
jgi:hypothetical protein